jgi:hypothetical protein
VKQNEKVHRNRTDGSVVFGNCKSLPEFKSTVVSNEYACVDANGRNAWSVAENALRGYKLQAYEYRFVGAGGNRNLILYFGK